MNHTITNRRRTAAAPIRLPFLVTALLLAGLLGLGSCSEAVAAGTIRGDLHVFDDLAVHLIGTQHGVRVRYRGTKSQVGFRAVAIGPDGQVAESRELGFTLHDEPLDLDGIAVATFLDVYEGGATKRLLSLRFVEPAGDWSMSSSPLVEDLFPSDTGFSTAMTSTPIVVSEDEGLPVYTATLSDRSEFRVEFFVR